MIRIGLIGENSINYIDILINIWNNGNSAVLIDWRIPLGTVCEMMNECGVQTCFIEKKLLPPDMNVDYINFIAYESQGAIVEVLSEDLFIKYQNNQSTKEAVVLFSSGTTGKAKGIILTHSAINENADSIAEYMCLDSNDSIYILKPLSHSSTLVGELLVGLRTNTRIIVSPTITATSTSLRNIEKFKSTVVCVNPSLLNLFTKSAKIHKMNFNYLKKIYTSGAIAESYLIDEARETFINIDVLNVYGLSEAGPRISAQRLGSDISGSVGFPINGVKVKIIGENGLNLNSFDKGIIHVKTPCLFSGYISGKEPRESLFEDWLNTGDIGYKDSEGRLFVTGRCDNMIVVGSHNVYPEEIESYIIRTGIVDDCIIIPSKNAIYGEKLVCFYSSNIDKLDELRKSCINHLANYEIPSLFHRLVELPKTANNKKIRELSIYQKYLES